MQRGHDGLRSGDRGSITLCCPYSSRRWGASRMQKHCHGRAWQDQPTKKAVPKTMMQAEQDVARLRQPSNEPQQS